MQDSYDVVIVGGVVIGLVVVYFLIVNLDFNGLVLVVECDFSYVKVLILLLFLLIRMQFFNLINVKISQYGLEFICNFVDVMQVVGEDRLDLNFYFGGYLFLVNIVEGEQILCENYVVQCVCGVDVVLWDQDELVWVFLYLCIDDICIVFYGQLGEGWFNNIGLMYGFKVKVCVQGVEYVIDEVVVIGCDGVQVISVMLKLGVVIQVGMVVNVLGLWVVLIVCMVGLDVLVELCKCMLFVFDCVKIFEGSVQVNQGCLLLMIDFMGVFCCFEGCFFLIGCLFVEDFVVDWDDFELCYEEFEEIIWFVLVECFEVFEVIKVVN